MDGSSEQPLPDSGYYSPTFEESVISEEQSQDVFTFDESSASSRSSSSNPPSPTGLLVLDHTRGTIYGRRAPTMVVQRRNSCPLPRTAVETSLRRSTSLQDRVSGGPSGTKFGHEEASTSTKLAPGQRQVAIVRPISRAPQAGMVANGNNAAVRMGEDEVIREIGNRLRAIADQFDRELEQRDDFEVPFEFGQFNFFEFFMQAVGRAAIFLFLH